jgi:hypothetical protein
MRKGASEAIIGGGGEIPHDAAGDALRPGIAAGLYERALPIGVGFLFFAVIVPAALVLRAVGRDRLHLRRDAGAASYWITRPAPSAAKRDA